jgi:hypothetical protein
MTKKIYYKLILTTKIMKLNKYNKKIHLHKLKKMIFLKKIHTKIFSLIKHYFKKKIVSN